MTDMVIPPGAREAAAQAIEDAAENKKRFEEDTWVEGYAGDFTDAALDAALPHLRPLFETATKVGLELGRKEALCEIANEMSTASPGQWADIRIPYVDVQLDKDTYRQLMAAREIGTKEAQQ